MPEDLLQFTRGSGAGLYKPVPSPSAHAKADLPRQKTKRGPANAQPGFIDRTLRCRHELKYRITEARAAAVEHFVRPYLHLDHYCKIRPAGAYPIVSLYLDSPGLKLCRQTMEGHKNRFKLRIRSYDQGADYPRFFEIKRRINTIIVKSRARVMPHDVGALLAGWALPPQDYSTDEDTLRQFQFYYKGINAAPVLGVRYLRRAYEGDSENRVRVTFDRHLAYSLTDHPNAVFTNGQWQPHLSNDVILEIKFTGRYPAWLSRMVAYFGLRQQSFSKYVTSVKRSRIMGSYFPPGRAY
jgi:hypothetical protein